MMQVRCQQCGWMFTLSREAIGLALAKALAKNERHHTINCIKCRHTIKLQTFELRRWLPPGYELPKPTDETPAEQTTLPEAEATAAKKPPARQTTKSPPAKTAAGKPTRKASTQPVALAELVEASPRPATDSGRGEPEQLPRKSKKPAP